MQNPKNNSDGNEEGPPQTAKTQKSNVEPESDNSSAPTDAESSEAETVILDEKDDLERDPDTTTIKRKTIKKVTRRIQSSSSSSSENEDKELRRAKKQKRKQEKDEDKKSRSGSGSGHENRKSQGQEDERIHIRKRPSNNDNHQSSSKTSTHEQYSQKKRSHSNSNSGDRRHRVKIEGHGALSRSASPSNHHNASGSHQPVTIQAVRKDGRPIRDASGRLLLQKLCDRGDYDRAKELLEMNVHVNDRDYAGNTAIHDAALKGHENIVELLLDHNAIIDIRSGTGDLDTPLIDAASRGRLNVVKLLLDRGADPRIYNAQGKTALDSLPSESEHFDELEKLLKEAAYKFRMRAKQHAALNNNESVISGDLDHSQNFDPSKSIPETFPPSMEQKRNGDSNNNDNNNNDNDRADDGKSDDGSGGNSSGNNGKDHSIPSGGLAASSQLHGLASGVGGSSRRRGARSQSIRNDLLWMDLTTRAGREQVYRKAADGDIQYVGRSLEEGWQPDGESMVLAAKHGHTDLVGLLLAFGADSDAVNEDGETALEQTIGRGHLDTVKLLLNSGANPLRRDNHGRSYVEIAKEALGTEDDAEVALLQKAMKDAGDLDSGKTSTHVAKSSSTKSSDVIVKNETNTSDSDRGGSTDIHRTTKKRKLVKGLSSSKAKDDSDSDLKRPRLEDENEDKIREKEGQKPTEKRGEEDVVVTTEREEKELLIEKKRKQREEDEEKEERVRKKEEEKKKKQEDEEKERARKREEEKRKKQEDEDKERVRKKEEERKKKLEEEEKEREEERERERERKKRKQQEEEEEKENERRRKQAQEEEEERAHKLKEEEERARKLKEEEEERKKRAAEKAARQQQREEFEAQKEKERKEREKRMLKSLEEEEKKKEEKRRKAEEQKQERFKQEKEELERRKQLEQEQESERQKALQQKRKTELRKNYPYGIRHAVYDNNGASNVEQVRKVLPLLIRESFSVKYFIDVQISLFLGMSNLYQSYPELTKKLVTDEEKTRLWSLLTPLMCRPIPPYSNSSTIDYEKIIHERNEDKRRFMSLTFFWLKVRETPRLFFDYLFSMY